jgi:hypothetical protein
MVLAHGYHQRQVDLANDANLHKPGPQQASYRVDHGSRIKSVPKTGLCPEVFQLGNTKK